MIDKDELRRLALLAQSDEAEPTAAVRLAPSGVALALALDPATVLALLDEAKTERASFEAACDAAEELDARLERLADDWVRRYHLTQAAQELRALLKERR